MLFKLSRRVFCVALLLPFTLAARAEEKYLPRPEVSQEAPGMVIGTRDRNMRPRAPRILPEGASPARGGCPPTGSRRAVGGFSRRKGQLRGWGVSEIPSGCSVHENSPDSTTFTPCRNRTPPLGRANRRQDARFHRAARLSARFSPSGAVDGTRPLGASLAVSLSGFSARTPTRETAATPYFSSAGIMRRIRRARPAQFFCHFMEPGSKNWRQPFRAVGPTPLGRGFSPLENGYGRNPGRGRGLNLRAFLTGEISNRSWFYDETSFYGDSAYRGKEQRKRLREPAPPSPSSNNPRTPRSASPWNPSATASPACKNMTGGWHEPKIRRRHSRDCSGTEGRAAPCGNNLLTAGHKASARFFVSWLDHCGQSL
jgi:hypothetical protein